MPSFVQIRPADAVDAKGIETLYRELVPNQAIMVTAERISEVRQDANTVLLVAARGGEVIGTALLSMCMDVMFQRQPFAVLENVVVKRDYRSLGVGTALMHEVDRIALERECSKVMLLSSASRTDAHRFFMRAGFQGEHKRGFIKYRRYFAAASSTH